MRLSELLFPALTALESVLDVGQSDISWAFAAYSCTFSAFLLISGRFSDVYSASKPPIFYFCFEVGE